MDIFDSALTAGISKSFYDSLQDEEREGIKILIKYVNSLVKKLSDIILYKSSDRIDTYIWNMYYKCSITKTLLNRNVPIKVRECFIPPDLSYKK